MGNEFSNNMKSNLVKDKSFEFAIRTVKLYQYLVTKKKESVLSKQLLRSGTSIGAMIRESIHAESTADFLHKMAIAQKEINESIYWIELLKATEFISTAEFESINQDAIELIKLITAIIKTTKANNLK